jgi:hypothetical protein
MGVQRRVIVTEPILLMHETWGLQLSISHYNVRVTIEI